MAKILIVSDIQKDFVTGSLGTQEAQAIVPLVAERIQQAKKDQESVIFMMDTHAEDYLQTSEGRHLPVPHCMAGSEGHQLVDDLIPLTDGARVAEKHTFGSLWLMGELAGLARAIGDPEGKGLTVEICGLCTDICVITNALLIKTRLPEAEIVVQARLCAGITVEKHLAALEVMRSCQVEVLA